MWEGDALGTAVGICDGCAVGRALGAQEGDLLGVTVGTLDGTCEGEMLGW